MKGGIAKLQTIQGTRKQKRILHERQYTNSQKVRFGKRGKQRLAAAQISELQLLIRGAPHLLHNFILYRLHNVCNVM